MSYIGQTSRSLKERCQEHTRYIRQRTPFGLCNAHPKQQMRIRPRQ